MLTARSHGWLPPPEAHRGVRAKAPLVELATLAPAVSLEASAPAVLDQGTLGSCTGHAVACGAALRLRWQSLGAWVPGALDLYLGARAREGTADRDAGAVLADVLKHAEEEGLAPAALWGFSDFRGPAPEAFAAARGRTRLVTWEPLDWHLDTLRWEIACGYPVVLGVRVYGSFDDVGASGVIPMPDGPPTGGHALCAIGYDDHRSALRVQNSWGERWGDKGRGWLPYNYALNPFWCGELHALRAVRRIEGATP